MNDLEQTAIERLRAASDMSLRLFEKPLVITYSGGKDDDVLDYAAIEKISMNPLYCEGFHRVGCVGCPMASSKQRVMEFAHYTRIKAAYIRAFDRMLEERRKRSLPCQWQSGVDGGRRSAGAGSAGRL